MPSVPSHYVPKNLSKKDKKKIKKELIKSRKLYKKGKYYTRKKISSFKSKKSNHIDNVKKIYNIEQVKPNNNLAKKTGCSIKALKSIVKKGQGAYYSSGSRPNQTATSWGRARLASSITGGPAALYDMQILKDGCKKTSKALKLGKKAKENKTRKHVQLGGKCIGKRNGKDGCRRCCRKNIQCLVKCMSSPSIGGMEMKEKIIKFEKAKNPKKKYSVIVQDKKTKKTRTLSFGASDYPQYRDSTPLKLYSSKDHGDFKRMQRYYSRHSGTKHRLEAIEKEKKINKGLYTPKILSHIYLW